MPHRPEIFISATTKDLKTCRQLVRDALLTLGCVPVVQDHFAPDSRTVKEMLRERIAGCDAVIHLAGECFGFEPQEHAAAEPRRSYTQMEYDIARELEKSLYTFVCAPDFPYDAHEPEDDERRTLQAAHRAALSGGDRLFLPVRSAHDLEKSVRELRFQVRSWIGRLVAVVIVALGLIGGLLWYLDHRTTAVEGRNSVLQQQNDSQTHVIASLQARLDEQTRISQQILALVQRGATEDKAEGKSVPVAAAQAQVATERKISVEELQKQLDGETANVRAILAQTEEHAHDTGPSADGWKNLRRKALLRFGEGELSAGHYREAVDPLRQALSLSNTLSGPEHPDTLKTADLLALAELNNGDLAGAEELFRGNMEVRARTLGPDHADTVQSSVWLAMTLFGERKYDDAEPLYRRALEVRERTLGSENRLTLLSLANLGDFLRARGDLSNAEALLRRALAAQEKTFGPDFGDTLDTIKSLAVTLLIKRDLAGAEPLYRRAVDARSRTLGGTNRATLLDLIGLADFLRAKSEALRADNNPAEAKVALDEAEGILRRVLDEQDRVQGPETADQLSTVTCLANVLLTKGDLAGAEKYYRRALEARDSRNPDDPDSVMNVRFLAAVLANQGKSAQAEPYFRRVVKTCEKLQGKEHADTLWSITLLARLLDSKGTPADRAEAEQLYERVLGVRRRGPGASSAETASAAYDFSNLEQHLGKLDAALALAKEADAIAKANLPEASPDRQRYESWLRDLQNQMAKAGKTG